MRFFFCRFLLESAVGLFLICGVVLRLSIWIFYISKIQMGGIYGEICTKKGIYQRKWRLCGIILHGVLPLQGIRPDLEVQRGKEYSDVFELAARKLGVAPEHCIVFDDVLPAIKSAKAARMLAGGIYDKYSADQRTEIERIADIYLLDFRQAPIPHKEV